MKKIVLALIATLFLFPQIAQAHGSVELINAQLNPDAPNIINYRGQYRVSSSHADIKLTVCLWHKEDGSNGTWNAVTSSCHTVSKTTASEIDAPLSGAWYQGSVDTCGASKGYWKTRAKGWVLGDAGTKHLERIDDSSVWKTVCQP